MNPTKAKEQSQDSRRRVELDDRYGEIGISAVAAAVRCKGEDRRRTNDVRFTPHDCD